MVAQHQVHYSVAANNGEDLKHIFLVVTMDAHAELQ